MTIKSVFSLALVSLVILGCSTPEDQPRPDSSEGTLEIVATPPPPLTNAAEIAMIAQFRDEWIRAFADGNPEPVEFIFDQGAFFFTPEHQAVLGEATSSAAELFQLYDAELALTGDQMIDEAKNWMTISSDGHLSLAPKRGGESIQVDGSFFVRFHRESDSTLSIASGQVRGRPASDFTLNYMSGDGPVQLSSLRDKPVVLVFGSFT